MDLKEALARAVDRQDLTAAETAGVVGRIMDGEATAAQVGALLTALRMKGESVDEVVGAAQAMRARMVRVASAESVLVDTCGTGGDGSGSVNVSTLAAFVAAACGVKVAKHGNRAMSSRSGSHDVIEALGLDPAPSAEVAARALKETGLCFMFAPTFHVATKHALGPRREIGFRTLFNLLGPLTNPAGARFHVNGVFALGRCEFLARAHRELGSSRALVVHGEGGLDEFATAGPTAVAELNDGAVKTYQVRPADFGLDEIDPVGLRGGDPADNARLLLAALEGTRGAIRNAALMTAAAAVYVGGQADDLKTATVAAAAAIDSGRAMDLLGRLRVITPR